MGRKKQDTYPELGNLIRRKRLEMGLSMAGLCKSLGRESDIHKVYSIEAGEYLCRMHMLIEIILAVGCTEDELREIGFKEKFASNQKAQVILKDLLDVL